MEFSFCNLERHFRFLFLLGFLISGPAFAQSLPPILQILEQEPQSLEEIEKLIQLRWFKKASESLTRYPAGDPHVQFLKGVIAMGVGRYVEALELLSPISDEKWKQPAQVKKAIVLSRLKRYDESLKLFEQLRITEKKWKVRDRLRWQAFKTALEAKKYQEGLALLKPVSSVKAKWWRGWCYFRLGQFDPALQNWNAIPPHRSFGFYPKALFWKGVLYEGIGLKKESGDSFQKLIEEYSGNYYGLLATKKLGLEAPQVSSGDTILNSQLSTVSPEYKEIIFKEAKRRRLDPYFVLGLIRQESHFRPDVVSGAGAMGLMQLIPQTALRLVQISGRKHFQWADLFDPQFNVSLGCLYLKFLKELFSGRHERIIAGYNAGEEAVSRWLKTREKESAIFFIEEIPYDQTQLYVQKVLVNYWSAAWNYTGEFPILKSLGTRSFSIDSKTAIK